MDNFRDFSALHDVLRSAYENVPAEERRAVFANMLQQELGFTTAQAQLYTSTVLCQNAEGSADWVTTNGLRVTGGWSRGEQEGNLGGWLSTTKETWQFNDDLTYGHKIERYEQSISTGPFFQSSYSQPKMSLERGIWAPPDTILDGLKLFVMSTDGFARSMTLEWIEKETLGSTPSRSFAAESLPINGAGSVVVLVDLFHYVGRFFESRRNAQPNAAGQPLAGVLKG